MALKDLLSMLQESTVKTKTRLAEDQSGLASAASQYMMNELPTSMGIKGKGGGQHSGGGGGLPTGGRLGAFVSGLRDQESGGNYGAVNSGSGALGAYQIMPSNLEGDAGWDMEALGRNVSTQQFLKSKALQDKIARYKLAQYFKQYGAAGAAKAWYAGPGNATLNSNAPQYGGPSVNAYARSVLKNMRRYL